VNRAAILIAVKALKNRANLLTFRYLWPADGDDQDDAWAGLLGCCWKARGNLYVAEENRPVPVATHDFIEDALADHLAPFERMAKRKIAAMALEGEFRHIPRVVRNRMADHVRKVYRANRAVSELPVPYEPTRQEQEQVLANIRSRIADELGRGPHEALCAVAATWPPGKSLRERKGKLTAAIMSTRNVSHQQATKDRANLLYMIAESHDPFLIALRTSAWFRYVFNLSEPKLRFAEFPANKFITEEKRNDETPPERRAA
jgi:hypothetical protein